MSRVERLLDLARALDAAWWRAWDAGHVDEAERQQVRSRAVSAALYDAVT